MLHVVMSRVPVYDTRYVRARMVSLRHVLAHFSAHCTVITFVIFVGESVGMNVRDCFSDQTCKIGMQNRHGYSGMGTYSGVGASAR